ncbi:MAG: hypothetical protein GY801_39235, partial [bacterium]|nr:hypothetical protein [bacterium]
MRQQMNDFPLQPFLIALTRAGIRLTVRDYERIRLVLHNTDGPWTIVRLRDVLSALLVKGEEQQDRFGREFNKWFSAQGDAEEQFTEPIDIQLVLQELRQLVRETPVPPPPKVKRPFRKLLQTDQEEVDTSRFCRWMILASVVVLVALGGGIWYRFSRPDVPDQLPKRRPPATQEIEPQEQIPTFDRKRLYQNVPYIKTVTYTPLLNPKNWLQASGLERWQAPYNKPVQRIETPGHLIDSPITEWHNYGDGSISWRVTEQGVGIKGQ